MEDPWVFMNKCRPGCSHLLLPAEGSLEFSWFSVIYLSIFPIALATPVSPDWVVDGS